MRNPKQEQIDEASIELRIGDDAEPMGDVLGALADLLIAIGDQERMELMEGDRREEIAG